MTRTTLKKPLSLTFIAVILLSACSGGETAATATTVAAAPTQLPAEPTQPPVVPTAAIINGATPAIVSGAGDIAPLVEQYRNLLGPDNGGDPGSHGLGRREITWDTLPDELAAPNNYLPDLFNAPTAPRARGIVLNTEPGAVIQVSADADNPTGTAPRFGHINPTYSDIFKTFSPERLFSPVGSNIVEATFFVPGTKTPARVRGFGAVYTDVDQDHTAFEYFDKDGQSLGKFPVPIANNGLSFLGVVFDQPIVARVRIEYGTVALGPNDDADHDAAVMDNFIYGEPVADPAAAVAGPTFIQDGAAVNRDPTRAAQSPSVAVGPDGAMWIAWAEDIAGNLRQIFVSALTGGAFQPRGGALSLHTDVVGAAPSITFAGEGNAVAWVVWQETSSAFSVSQIYASRFDLASGAWQATGQDRGHNEPSLNIRTNREATHPFIFAGSGDPAQPDSPWVAWEELSGASNFVQVFVARGVKDDAAIGGFRWETAGENRFNDEPTLNVDPRRDALHPVAVFAENGNAVPWVVWQEIGVDQPQRLFAARGQADTNTPGGFKWVTIPACAPSETACTLNVNPDHNAQDPAVTAGALTPGEAPAPWVAWAEASDAGNTRIFVARYDLASGQFFKVGGYLNVNLTHDAKTPFIAFVKNVPYVAWLEDDGTGKFNVQVRHLASDPQTGTWALDTPEHGFNFNADFSDNGLFAIASPDSLLMAWTEGDPKAAASQIVAGHLTP